MSVNLHSGSAMAHRALWLAFAFVVQGQLASCSGIEEKAAAKNNAQLSIRYDGASPTFDLILQARNNGRTPLCIRHLDFIEKYGQIEIRDSFGKYVPPWYSNEVGSENDYQNQDFVVIKPGLTVKIPILLNNYQLRRGEPYIAAIDVTVRNCRDVISGDDHDKNDGGPIKVTTARFKYAGEKLIGQYYPFLNRVAAQ